ncbi:serine/threonine protein kinase [Nitrosomonas sp. Is79A3]|uniref:protein kinase domain-containing protein n=1 Tax=Nitrosomonas sp. (strain Is79A3) TaxID=261292 RepID=UPI000215C91D
MTNIHDQILPAGTQIGVYEIKGTVKVNPFDITYRAWNHHLKEPVKIQEYFPHVFAVRTSDGLGVAPKSPEDEENFDYGLKAFLDQAEMLTQIEHPNLVVAENSLLFNGTAYLIMSTREGVSLSKLIQSETAFAETELKFILVSILNALQKIHEYRMVHGGIQPAAIFLGKDGEPLLTDFAAARLAIAARTAQFAAELASGYAPAEQYESVNTPGPATDFYALGATMSACITHRQPIAAQSRVAALSQGESDPMGSLSASAGTAYSAELLQAIDWMLQPEYSRRPQAAGEILSLLKSESASNGQEGTSNSEQTVSDANRNNQRYLWIGIMTGIVALVTFGLWFDKKPAETVDGKQSTVATQPLFQRNPGKTIVTPEIKENQPAAPAIVAQSNPESDSVKVAEPVKLPELADETTPLKTNTDEALIQKHLVAAEKAYKAGHFTTPSRGNAYKYYQIVLTMEPSNAEARAGLQKIVDRYVQFIEKAKTEGKLNMIRLYLQRAESVLPDDPKLQNIRKELAAQ